MPKVKLGMKKIDPLVEQFIGRITILGMSYEEAGAPIMSQATLSRRFRDPGKFTREELHHLSRKLNIPIDEIREKV